ncbi:MAG TPA: LacI family DNA-binding transcriptional regulator [Opitutaceae bacterium]|nr:LacI family DNA-binding transcriptional regulator [Opitutaceae bacterium]
MFSNPTIKDVARVAGVHFTTVSMALRGHPSIPATTRDRIVAAAGRIGYRRDAVFSALSNRRSRDGVTGFAPRIAFVVNRSPEEGFFKRTHNRVMVEGARQQAESLGYRFELLFVDKGHHDSASLYRYLRKTGVTGVIIGGFEAGRDTLEMDWSSFCVVKIDSRHMDPAVTLVSTDQLNGVRVAFQRMRALGYKRIGLAVGLHDEEGTDDMHVSGLLLEQPDIASPHWIPPMLFPHGATGEIATPLLRDWIRAHKLDAVVCNWTNIRTMITDGGFRMPQQVACACICLSRKNPALAGIVSNMGMVGERVTTLLATLLRTERRGVPELATHTYVEGKWYDGASAPLRS